MKFFPKDVYGQNWFQRHFHLYKDSYSWLLYVPFLRISYMWKSFQDDSPYHCFVLSFHTIKYNCIGIFSITDDGFHLGTELRSFKNHIFHFIKIWKINREIFQIEDLAYSVCNDPMNGCPEDFAEDFSRRILHLTQKRDEIIYG